MVEQVVEQVHLIDRLLRHLIQHDAQHRGVGDDVHALVREVSIFQVSPNTFPRLRNELLARSLVQLVTTLDIFLDISLTVVSLLSPDIPDVLVGFRTVDVRGNIESSRVDEDGDIRYRETIVEEHDDAIKDIQTLVVEILPVPTFEGTRARNVILDEWILGFGVRVSGHVECLFHDSYSCGTRVSAAQATERINEGRLATPRDPGDGKMEAIILVLDAPFGGGEFFGGRRYDWLDPLLQASFRILLGLHGLPGPLYSGAGRLLS